LSRAAEPPGAKAAGPDPAPTAIPAGNLYVVAAPSGGGKTTLVNALLGQEPGIRLSVSFTTRPPRPGEVDGVHYHFVDAAGFHARREAGEFLEHAEVHGNWYATSATWLAAETAAGRDVLLEIDWQGAHQVRRLIASAVTIFVLPPSLAALRERLEKRGQDSPAVIARRLEAARDEMRHCGEFDYVIINQEFASAVADLTAIVRASRLRAATQCTRHAALLDSLLAPPT
jgi:guanylate kinase